MRCDGCGRFVSYEDVEKRLASHVLITPDSEYSEEEFETLCAKCYIDVTNALGADMEIY